MLKLCSNKCDQCLMTKNKVVSNERRREIIKDITKDGEFFICHKSPEGDKWVCRGVYDALDTRDIRLMKLFPEMLPLVTPK